ncbi:hypothetical protein BDF19DRAFT_261968 [Syncephalis fuscata]|nr:hypothetical protein BDF19DRAFT_261968 [Syncephalis fuscata]
MNLHQTYSNYAYHQADYNESLPTLSMETTINPSTELCISNLDVQHIVTVSQLTNILNKFGNIKYIHFPYALNSQEPCRHAFVQYNQISNAQCAMNTLQQTYIGNRKINIQMMTSSATLNRSTTGSTAVIPPSAGPITTDASSAISFRPAHPYYYYYYYYPS